MTISKNLKDALDSVQEISELYRVKTICFSCDGEALGACHSLDTLDDFEHMQSALYQFLETSRNSSATQHNIAGVLINAVGQFLTEHPETLIQ